LAGLFEVPAEDLSHGAIGGVRAETTKSFGMATDDVYFYVFPTATDADEGRQGYVAETQRLGLSPTSPAASFGYPTTQLTGVASAPFIGTAAISFVFVQVGNVLIVSESYALPEAQTQSEINAADLAAAGVAHLEGLLLHRAPVVSEGLAIVDLLATSGFPGAELPPGFASAEVSRISGDVQQHWASEGFSGALGGAVVNLPGDDRHGVIVYFVYPTVDEAQAAYATAQAVLPPYIGSCGGDQPGELYARVRGMYTNALCVVPVGNVLVVGVSSVYAIDHDQATEDQATGNATDLARAGVAHLERLIGGTG
jgi:hypothetical protein